MLIKNAYVLILTFLAQQELAHVIGSSKAALITGEHVIIVALATSINTVTPTPGCTAQLSKTPPLASPSNSTGQ